MAFRNLTRSHQSILTTAWTPTFHDAGNSPRSTPLAGMVSESDPLSWYSILSKTMEPLYLMAAGLILMVEAY